MAKVSLDRIWKSSNEELIPILESQGQQASPDIRFNRTAAAILYYNAKLLDEGDQGLISNPSFSSVMISVDSLEAGKRLLAISESRTQTPQKQESGLNAGLIKHFEQLTTLYHTVREAYRAKAFEQAVNVIKIVPTPITLVNYKELKSQPGIGASSLNEIYEYLTTGTSSRLKDLQARTVDKQAVLELFKGVYGIGDVKAGKYFEQGYRTLDDLLQAPLTDAEKVGLKWYHHLKERIPRAEMEIYIKVLEALIGPQEGTPLSAGRPGTNAWIIAGSYRRGEPTSGDIDILMRNDTGASLTEIVEKLQNSSPKIIEDVLALGTKKFMGVVRLGEGQIARRIDIRLFEPANWAYALLYNTGSQKFNILTRQRAIDLGGLRLNEYELQNNATGQMFPANTEEDIFRYLGIKYLTPEQRTKDLASLTPE